MRLESVFLVEVLRLMIGRVVRLEEGTMLAERLGSQEELLAWILLRQNVAQTEPDVARLLVDLAHSKTTKAETRRERTGFPIDERKALRELETVLGELLNSDKDRQDGSARAYDSLVRFVSSSKDVSTGFNRYGVGIGY